MEFPAANTKNRWSLAVMKCRVCRSQTVLHRIVLAGWVLSVPAGAFSSAGVCPPAVLVDGSSEIAPTVSLILKQHGVGGPGPTACGGPIIRAVLTRGTAINTFTLHIVDGYGRSSERQVANPKDAASLIESWATAEDADVILPPALPALPVIAEAPPREASPVEPHWHVLASGEIARASDDSTWYGGAATVCRRIGPTCVGARARVARDTGKPLFTGELNRTALDGAIAVATGFVRGRLTLAPMLAVGARWTRSALTAVPVSLSTDDVGIHAEAATIVAFAVSRRWSLVAELGAAARFFSSSRGGSRPSFFTLAGPVPADPIPLPPAADVHLSFGVALAP
jgi:hypothetical protein